MCLGSREEKAAHRVLAPSWGPQGPAPQASFQPRAVCASLSRRKHQLKAQAKPLGILPPDLLTHLILPHVSFLRSVQRMAGAHPSDPCGSFHLGLLEEQEEANG